MSTETQYARRDRSIFAPRDRDVPKTNSGLSVAYHNIHDVVPRAKEELDAYLKKHYGIRGGAMDIGRDRLGFGVHTVTPEIESQAAYLGEMIGKDFRAYPLDQLKQPSEPTLIVPYIHTTDSRRTLDGMHAETWGLPSRMVDVLKNKASFHALVEASNVEGLEVPDFEVADFDNLVGTSEKVLRSSIDLYARHGMTESYPLGVVIRGDESDGNYGMALVSERQDGKVQVLPNGKLEGRQVFEKGQWTNAFKFAKQYLNDETSEDNQPKFVVSRMIDREEEPGLSVIVTNGEVTSLGWNGQLKLEETTACVGTADYETSIAQYKDLYIPGNGKSSETYNKKRLLQGEFEEKTAQDFAAFLAETSDKLGIPFDTVTGVANIDIMIPGPLENELRKKRGMKPGYYVAESNPRWTNYTDALVLSAAILGEPPTINGLTRVIKGGIATSDNYKDPYDATYESEQVRDRLREYDQQSKQDGWGARTIMRMPGTELGVIFLGDIPTGKQILDSAIRDRATAGRSAF